MKRILTLLLTICATTLLWAANNVITYTAPAKLTETDEIYYGGLYTKAFNVTISSHTFSGGTGKITFSGNVTKIGESAFYLCESLTSITIPYSVTSIGDCAFCGCHDLKDVDLPYGLTTIGERAFYACYTMDYVEIPGSVTSIGSAAFGDCSIKSFYVDTIGNSYRSIDGVLFNYAATTLIQYPTCHSRKTYSVPTTVTTIGEYAFYYSALTSITIPSSVKTIKEYAFQGSNQFTTITVPSSVTSIGEAAFANCSLLTSISVNTSNTKFTSVDGVLFDYAKKTLIQYPVGNTRTSYTIPDVTTISPYAFNGCTKLTSVTIPGTVTSIGDYAFGNCTGLTAITCNATTPPACGLSTFNEVNKSIPLYVPSSSVSSYKTATGWKDFTNMQVIPQNNVIIYTATEKLTNVESTSFNASIVSHDFYDGMGIITFSDDITTIGSMAFWFCSDLISVTIPNSVTSIGSHAFGNCTSLTSITIPNGVTSIGNFAFSCCTSLKHITMSSNVKNIGTSAFESCHSLATFDIPASVCNIGTDALCFCTSLSSINVNSANEKYASINGALFNYDKDTLIQYPIGRNQSSYIIPNSTITIGTRAFASCKYLTSVTIPSSVTTIGPDAFYKCVGLSSITIPNNVKTLGSGSFESCESIPHVSISKNLTQIGCCAFRNCYSLTAIDVDSANPRYVSKDGVLFNHAMDTLIQYPIGNSQGNYTIPNGVTFLEEFSFINSKLLSITLPSCLKKLGICALSYCSKLISITCYSSIVPTCDMGCFDGIDKSIPIYVPKSSIEAYKAASSWEDFKNYQAIPIPTVADLEKYDPTTNIVLCVKFEQELCNDVVVIGGYNEWNTSDANMVKMEVLVDYDDWRVAVIPFSKTDAESNRFKPVHLQQDGSFNWGYTTGGSDSWSKEGIDGATLTLTDEINDECMLSCTTPGAYIYKSTRWKNNTNPCLTPQNYEIRVYPPSCLWVEPTIAGSFDLWADANHTMTVHVDNNMHLYYSYSLTQQMPDAEYNIKGGKDWGNPIEYFDKSSGTWKTIPNQKLGDSSLITLDWSDADQYRYHSCSSTSDSVTYLVIAKFPACEATIPLVTGSFCNWTKGITMIPTGNTNEYYALVRTKYNDDINFKDVATGRNNYLQLWNKQTYKWEDAPNIKLKDTQTIQLDYTNSNSDDQISWKHCCKTTYRITYPSMTNGTVSGPNYAIENEPVTLTAIPNPHYHFVQWSDGDTTNPRSVVLTRDTTLAASFAIDRHTITTASDNGSVTGAESGSYDYGTQLTITATPDASFRFIEWADGDTTNPRTIQLTQDTTLTAFFTDKYAVKASGSNGTVEGDGWYSYGTYAMLIAWPDAGYEFIRWSDGTEYNPHVLYITEDIALTAIFEPATAIHQVGEDSGTYTIYNANGLVIYHGNDAHFTLPAPGMYIIQHNSTIEKVIVQ